MSGTCRLDGQDDPGRGGGDEQQNAQESQTHLAYALGLALAAEQGENNTQCPPEWRQRHGDPLPEDQPIGIRIKMLMSTSEHNSLE